MRKDYRHISSIEDLHAERIKLKLIYEAQGEQLVNYATEYVEQYKPLNIIKRYFNRDAFDKVDDKLNLSGKAMSLILPFILNKTIFKGSGFLTKTAIGLISNKLGGKLDLDHLTGFYEKIKGWVTPKNSKPVKHVDYGIPPDSETY